MMKHVIIYEAFGGIINQSLMWGLFNFLYLFYADLEMKGNTIYNGKYIVLEVYDTDTISGMDQAVEISFRYGSDTDELHYIVELLKKCFSSSEYVFILDKLNNKFILFKLYFAYKDMYKFTKDLRKLGKTEEVIIHNRSKKFGI